MKTEFRKAIPATEIRSLMAFDRKVFPPSDLFDADYWKACVVYWLIVDGVKVGCCAFEEHVDFQEDLSGVNSPRKGSLYIASTGILPRFQGQGLGTLLKSWQLCYARHHRFKRIVTNTRSRNTTMLILNQQFGFRIIRTTPRYYSDPSDATVVMELRFSEPASRRSNPPSKLKN
jgi:ribosomal protein S18 acetylase RimI-like enzyme